MNKYKINLKGSNIQKVEDCSLFTSGNESRRFGIGFLTKENYRRRVKCFDPKSDRLCAVRIKAERDTITVTE